MNYQKVHDQIIDRALKENRKRLKKDHPDRIYYENHHILPRCMGGTDDKENLVLLTAREHFLIHWLLYRIYPKNNKLCFSFWKMCFGNTLKKNINSNFKISSVSFQEAREANSKCSSELLKGNNNAWNNKKCHTVESKEKSKKSNLNFWHNKRTNEQKIEWNKKCSIRNIKFYQNISEENREIWKKNIAKSFNDKTKDEKDIINKKRSIKLAKFKVLVFLYSDNSFIGEFESSGLACKALNIRNNIARFFLGYVNHVGGYTFKRIKK